MKKQKIDDAFGKLLLDLYRGQTRHEIVERDDGYFDAIPADRYLGGYRTWPARERQAMRAVRGRVLDIGCGAGRHALYLQKKGFRVTGIDVSPLAINVCRLRGLRDARVLSITDIGKLHGEKFGSVLMMCNNFGLFGDRTRAKSLLKRLAVMTTLDARIITQIRDPYTTKNPIHRAYHRWNLARGRMVGQLRLRIHYERLVGPWFDYLFVSERELRDILSGTAWKLQKVIDRGRDQYIAIIKKTSAPREKSPRL